MFLHVGNNKNIRLCNVVGIFDMDNTTVSRQGRDFLPQAEKTGALIYSADDLPKSYVVTEHDGKMQVYLSSFSSKLLISRAKSSDLLT